LKRTSLKARGKRVTKKRRWVNGVVAKEGKGIGTASVKREEEAEETEKEEVDGVEGEEDVEGVEDGLEKMMCESEGVG